MRGASVPHIFDLRLKGIIKMVDPYRKTATGHFGVMSLSSPRRRRTELTTCSVKQDRQLH